MHKKNSSKSKKTLISNRLVKAVKQLVKINKEAESLGLFVDDRELLECPKCGLMEDVDINGTLFTVFENSPNKDTGLRFKKIKNSKTFCCPNCGQQISENIKKILEVQ
jgi:transcription elongation factor Elf1